MVDEFYSTSIQSEIEDEERNERMHNIARDLYKHIKGNYTNEISVSILKREFWNWHIKIYELKPKSMLFVNYNKKILIADIVFSDIMDEYDKFYYIRVYNQDDMGIFRELAKYIESNYEVSNIFHIEKNFRE